VTSCPCEKEDIVEGMDGRREREYCCRVSGLLEHPHRADASPVRSCWVYSEGPGRAKLLIALLILSYGRATVALDQVSEGVAPRLSSLEV
jgi:hypothetical protein